MESDENEIGIPEIGIPDITIPEQDTIKTLTESDDEYEIPLPPGPPPLRAFEQQFTPIIQSQNRIPPPPPPGGPPPFRGPFPVYTPGGRIPPPPPYVYQQPMCKLN